MSLATPSTVSIGPAAPPRRSQQNSATLDIQVFPRTVARILKDLDYRLPVNHKRVSAGSGPDRDQQFQYIAEQHAQFAQRGLPIVSIDTKKRELVGNFKKPAPPTTPPTSLQTTWSDGGNATASNATAAPQSYWCSPTPAAATRRASAASSMPSGPASLIRTSSPSPLSRPQRRLQVEPHRPSPVQRDQQELGRPPAALLPDDPQPHPHHHHGHRVARDRTTSRPRIPERRQIFRRSVRASIALEPHQI